MFFYPSSCANDVTNIWYHTVVCIINVCDRVRDVRKDLLN